VSGEDLFRVPPESLGQARLLAHAACQWPSKAARANLPALPDDSHSNLGWDHSLGALVSRDLDAAGHRLAFEFASRRLLWLNGGRILSTLLLNIPDSDDSVVGNWTDNCLVEAGLQRASGAEIPYELESPAFTASEHTAAALDNLGLWYRSAHHALSALTEVFADLSAAPVEVRCWPHHFDIAVLFALDKGDPETARSIGVGMSPGDGNYDQPYYYCSPWPAPSANRLPETPAGFHWHTEGFVSLVTTAEDLREEFHQLDTLLIAAVNITDKALNKSSSD
jgi:hypothetical protein